MPVIRRNPRRLCHLVQRNEAGHGEEKREQTGHAPPRGTTVPPGVKMAGSHALAPGEHSLAPCQWIADLPGVAVCPGIDCGSAHHSADSLRWFPLPSCSGDASSDRQTTGRLHESVVQEWNGAYFPGANTSAAGQLIVAVAVAIVPASASSSSDSNRRPSSWRVA